MTPRPLHVSCVGTSLFSAPSNVGNTSDSTPDKTPFFLFFSGETDVCVFFFSTPWQHLADSTAGLETSKSRNGTNIKQSDVSSGPERRGRHQPVPPLRFVSLSCLRIIARAQRCVYVQSVSGCFFSFFLYLI